jgi:hypothetical protein
LHMSDAKGDMTPGTILSICNFSRGESKSSESEV